MGTLRIELGEGPLREEHDRLVETALRRGGRPPERQPGETLRGKYPEGLLLAAQSVWRARMIHEHRSAAVFSNLLPQLMEAEANHEVKMCVLRMAMDELRHAHLCAQIVEALGGEAVAVAELRVPPLPAHRGCSAQEVALRNVLFASCLSETISMALLTEERELTKEPLIRRVVTQLVGDETLHAKLGWIYLDQALPALDEAQRSRLDAYLPLAFGHIEARMHESMPLRGEPSAAQRQAMESLGLLDSGAARELLEETFARIILPQLEDRGLDARAAWEARRLE
ncbi:MAG: ferritin-like domain-containing protein [Myxococcales bacterium]|nr:ferritin-like domain-containing protein [Myxococcales bacterium]